MKHLTTILICIASYIGASAQTAHEYLVKGMGNYLSSNSAEAISNYSKALASDSNQTDVYYYRGLCYLSEKNFSKALPEFGTYLEKNPDDKIGYAIADMGLCYYALKLHDKALNDFNLSLKYPDCRMQVFYMRACLYIELNKYDSALSDLNNVISLAKESKRLLSPDSTVLYNSYMAHGILLQERKNRSGAANDFTKAINLKSNNPDAYILRGRVYILLNKPAKANLDLTQAIKLAENDDQAYYYRGIARISMLDTTGGLQDLKTSRNLGNEDAAIAIKNYDVIFK